jgi:tRNA-splicing ligase RtcB (3'-phosphate/5'-hydroxy nucleic acid ligase)
MKYFQEDGLVIKSWCESPEEGAVEQAKNLARLPFAFHHICLMPDTHQGYGMPIGGVMATNNVVIPNAVGKDIACGMCAVQTSLTDIDTYTLKSIMTEIRNVTPVGFKHNEEPQDINTMPDGYEDLPIVSRQFTSALKQIGSLGGGNHFQEIQKGDDGHIWIMIHSGSRNLGKQVADYYDKIAIAQNQRYFSMVPKAWQLAFLPIETQEAKLYMREMQYCVDFALANRKLMMDRIIDIFDKSTGCSFAPMINIAHNYAAWEHHFGKNVIVHRKGATSAKEGEIGIIPGSQGTSSYIVRGKGNPDSFNSCSHGAGRKMGRKQAERTLNLEKEIKHLDDRGILHSIRTVQDLDEAAGAYKDIDIVMEEQQDLVEIMVKLKPLAVIKG